MKRFTYFVWAALLAFVLHTPSLSAQENLFDNPGFEEWSGEQLQGAWSAALGTASQETDIKLGGDYALRLTGKNKLCKLTQSISSPDFRQGDVYALTVNYHVVKGDSWSNLVFNSNWDGDPSLDEDLYRMEKGKLNEWKSLTIETTVPRDGHTLNFILEIDAEAEVIVDDFAFVKTDKGTPFLNVTPASLPLKETIVGTAVEVGVLTAEYGNLPNGRIEEQVSLTGTNADQFRLSVATPDEGRAALTVTYDPTKPSSLYGTPHQAYVSFDIDGAPELNMTVRLQGKATDPSYSPEITVDKTEIVFPETKAGESRRETLSVSSREMKEAIHAQITGSDGVFTLNTNILPVNQDNQPLHIDFRPKKEGIYKATVTLSSLDAEDIIISVTGTATGDITKPDKQGDDYPLDTDNPLRLLNETFGGTTHNSPIALDGWKNIAEQNYRAWWGYDIHTNTEVSAADMAAKATLYNKETPEDAPYEMWLYTPALDFKNAASKTFTFRVSANLISDEARTDSVELYYVEPDAEAGNGLFRQKLEVYMPSKAEDNGEWMSYHLDLGAEGNTVADVFFMAFRVSGTGGNATVTSYYVDDVSFGRTDLPKITLEPERPQIAFDSQLGATARTPAIGVTAENLTEPIALSVGGDNKSKFKVSPATLPAEGGTFSVEFASDQVGVHAAYVKLASRGAADVYLDMLVNNQPPSGIDEATGGTQVWTEGGHLVVTSDRPAQLRLFTPTGQAVAQYSIDGGRTTLPEPLDPGLYIVSMTDDDRSTSHKVQVR